MICFIENVYFQKYMKVTMRNFKNKIKIVQKGLRTMIKIKRARFWALNIMFKKLQDKLLERKISRRTSDSAFPLANIEVEIRNFYKIVVKAHIGFMKKYKERLKSSKENPNEKLDKENYIKRPVLNLYGRSEQIINRLRYALGLDQKSKISVSRRFTNKSSLGRRQSLPK